VVLHEFHKDVTLVHQQLLFKWFYSGVTVVLQWCYSGVTMTLATEQQWCYGGVTVLQWCYIVTAAVVLRWCFSEFTVVLYFGLELGP
jgi:hypothetical protein